MSEPAPNLPRLVAHERYIDSVAQPPRFSYCIAIAYSAEVAAEIARRCNAHDDLVAMLRSTAYRFERCMIASGTDPEFAAEAVKPVHDLLQRIGGQS